MDRLDDNHPVGRFRPVNSSGSSIFQNRHASHPVHVQIDNRFQCRFDTVQNKQRLIRVIIKFRLQTDHTRLSPDFNVRHPVRVRSPLFTLQHQHGRIQAFQTLDNVLAPDHFQVFFRVGSKRSRETFFITGIDSGHHHFLNRLGIFLQGYIQCPRILYRNFPCLHPDTRECQHHAIQRRQGKRELPVGIRGRAQRGTFQHDRYPRNGAAVLVRHDTPNNHTICFLGKGTPLSYHHRGAFVNVLERASFEHTL